MANKNNPSEKHEIARVVKHPGKRDRDVVGTPHKPELVLKKIEYEPKPVMRLGLDGVYRVWDKKGKFVGFGEREDMLVIFERLILETE